MVAEAHDLPGAERVLTAVGEAAATRDDVARRVRVSVNGRRPGAGVLVDALRRLDDEGVSVLDVAVRRPTLDDVFLRLTGHVAEEHPADGDASRDGATGRGRGGRKTMEEVAR